MELSCFNPLRAATFDWSSSLGPRVTLVCRMTFDLCPGVARLSEDQLDVSLVEEPLDVPGGSLYQPSDRIPWKRRCDVVLVGHAHAPEGLPVRSLVARLAVGDVDKRLEVVCDRFWNADGALCEGPRFSKMPLRFERAGQGRTRSNPLGVAGEPDALGRRLAPNLQPFGTELVHPDEILEPVGFGPLSSAWIGAREGASESSPSDVRASREVTPLDFDPSFTSCAPRDQQSRALAEDLTLVLQNLSPEHPRLATRLPGLRPRALALYADGRDEELALVADTLWIDCDRALCTLSWRGSFSVSASRPAQVLVASERRGEPLSWDRLRGLERPPRSEPEPRAARWSEIVPRARAATLVGAQPGETLNANPTSARAVLPFVPVAALEDTPSSASRGVSPPALVQRLGASSPDWRAEHASPWARGAAALLLDAPELEPLALPKSVPPSPKTTSELASGSAVELLWYDTTATANVRRAFAELIAAVPPEPGESAGRDDAELDVHDVLVNGEACDGQGLQRAFEEAKGKRGRFRAPLVVVAGSLSLCLSELELLRATIELSSPSCANDKRAREILDDAKRVADLSTLRASPAIDGALVRVRAAVVSLGRQETLDAVNLLAERSVIEARRTEKRTLFGVEQLRAELRGGGRVTTAYVPQSIETRLPQLRELPVRLIVEVHPAQEQGDPQPTALKVIALGRVLV